MGGKDAIKKLIDIDPSIKAIVSSGYFNNPIMADYKQYGFSGVIPKPYEMEDLSELLDKVINEK
jgi:DNA-binding NarL/FixJ family response regulator